MLTVIVILCVLIWLPIMFHQISQRGFIVLLIWLLIAPVATNVIGGHSNPFFSTPEKEERSSVGITAKYYKTDPQTIVLMDFVEPTRILFSLFLFVSFISAVRRKKHLVPLDSTERWMCIFSIILIANVLLQSNRLPYGMRIASDAFIVPFVAYYVVRRLVITEHQFRQLTRVLGYLGLYLIMICLIERVTYSHFLYRISGPFDAPYSLYITLTAALLSVLAVNEKRTLPHAMVLYLSPVIIFLTLFRGNWVGFLSSVWIFLLLRHSLVNRSEQFRSMGLVLTLIPLILLGVQTFAPTRIVESRIMGETTVNWRLERWRLAWEEGLENPVVGIGLNNMRDVLGAKGMNYTAVHNSFLTLFAENGLLGLSVFLAIVTSIIRMGFRLYRRGPHLRDQWRGMGAIAILVAYVIPALFSNTLHTPRLSNVYVFAFLGAITGIYNLQRPVTNGNSKGTTWIDRESPMFLLQDRR